MVLKSRFGAVVCVSLLPSSLGYAFAPPALARAHSPFSPLARGALDRSPISRGPVHFHAGTLAACAWGMDTRGLLKKGIVGGVRAAASNAAVALSCEVQVEQFPCLSDNYGYLIHDSTSGETVAIDTPDADAYLEALGRRGWKLTQIWNTHHHYDHAGGNKALKDATGCRVVGPEVEADKIPVIDVAVKGGDVVSLGALRANVIDVGGHTKGHIAFHFADFGKAFVGDALFAMGCGRMFEGTYEQMFASLQRLSALSDDTVLFCAHEYTLANAKFALSVEPTNAALRARVKQVEDLRAQGLATVPTDLRIERETNPFLRHHSAEIREVLKLPKDVSDVDVFAAIRKAKDKF